MKIEIIEKCFIGTGGNLMPGDVIDVDERVFLVNIMLGNIYVKVIKAILIEA